jgi:hypothetical protein
MVDISGVWRIRFSFLLYNSKLSTAGAWIAIGDIIHTSGRFPRHHCTFSKIKGCYDQICDREGSENVLAKHDDD